MSAAVELVLLRPRNPENLGAIARAMRNFELSSWTIVDPRTLDFASARRVAVHAEELLDRPRVVESLDAAIADADWVVGTSSRHVSGLPTLTPRQLAEQASGRRLALVFGDERSGMSNAEIARCHALARIPTGADQPSLNLAQAVAVFAYELRLAAATPRASTRPAATDEQLGQLEAQLAAALIAGGFLQKTSPRHALRDLMRALQRAQLSPKEWRLWMAATGKLAKR